ncbi:MAG TPA: B12-binding domain/radical SAM domain-containing protein, partial [Rikenellaceae bacterium]|nr:B12-binding domain/radical SAM domain-containing protein [Rikenellaceae bacterium]
YRQHIASASVTEHLDGITDIGGRWIVSWPNATGIQSIAGSMALRSKNLLSPTEMFGVRTGFDVFPETLTAHVFSGAGRGCAYDCSFCSERRSSAGPITDLDTAATRLTNQIAVAVNVISEDYPDMGASAFVEDSTFLAGSKRELRHFINLKERRYPNIQFGAQLTIDQVLKHVDLLRDLQLIGLSYLFIGIETLDPRAVGHFSKDVHRRKSSWLWRAEKAIELLCSTRIHCGGAVLFGLGETHQDRINLFHQLIRWRSLYGMPHPVSINWAVQHPLKGCDGSLSYRYDKWGIPPGPWLDAFSDFGEASVLYPIVGQKPPVFDEVKDIATVYRAEFLTI